MNQNISSKQIRDFFVSGGDLFFEQLTGSQIIWNNDKCITEDYFEDDNLKLHFKMQTYLQPTGEYILPSTPIDQRFAQAGSFNFIAEMDIKDEGKISVQWHGPPHNFLHLQKGRVRKKICDDVGSSFGQVIPNLFLMAFEENKIVGLIEEIRKENQNP